MLDSMLCAYVNGPEKTGLIYTNLNSSLHLLILWSLFPILYVIAKNLLNFLWNRLHNTYDEIFVTIPINNKIKLPHLNSRN